MGMCWPYCKSLSEQCFHPSVVLRIAQLIACAQVISAELNRVVVELLQQLLFWQERQKAQDPLKATKKKRLVSGLRSVTYHVHRA